MTEAAQTPTSPEAKPSAKPGMSKAKKIAIIIPVLVIGILLAYRFAGTRTYVGTVQRVYEKEGEFRVELRDKDGTVLVAANEDMKFPYVKLDSADLHANLHRFAQTGDLVKAKVWGFRLEWFSVFPNVVDAEFAESKKDRTRKRAEKLADAVIHTLIDKGALKGGDGVRDDVVQAISDALDPLPQ